MLLAIVGKRNAGKSTLVNSIAQLYEEDTDRVIVSEVPGTTRDSIDVRFEKDGKALLVIDTAGVRKKSQMINRDIDFYSFHRAQRSIRRCDVAVMLMDATLPVSEPDKKLARYIADELKPVVLVMNKWDLAMEKTRKNRPDIDDTTLMEEFGKYLDETLVNLDFAPIVFFTAKDSKNVQIVLDTAQRLFNQASTRLTTGQLNRSVRQILQEKVPSTPSGRKARIYYATQTSVAPPPSSSSSTTPNSSNESYQRFMVNRFRELLPFGEVPMKLVLRGRTGRVKAKSLDEATDAELETGTLE